MAERRIGIIVNGATGRMGYRQHLVRSLLAIRDQGGVEIADGDRLVPDLLLVGRNEEKLRMIAERHGLKALLINPAVMPHRRFDGYLGPQTNLYSGEVWELTEDHVTALAELETAPPEDAERYQVWLQTGDETLDYRDAAQFYRGCALRIQAGGDHGFQGFAERLPALLAFAGFEPQAWLGKL